eukprot:2505864-Karenia_brevis.AAC.1
MENAQMEDDKPSEERKEQGHDSSDADSQQGVEDENDSDGGAGAKTKAKAKAKAKPVKLWLEKDLQIGVAQREHLTWKQEMKSVMRNLHCEGLQLLDDIAKSSLSEKLLPETTLTKPRIAALGYVLGLPNVFLPHHEQATSVSPVKTQNAGTPPTVPPQLTAQDL